MRKKTRKFIKEALKVLLTLAKIIGDLHINS